MVYIENPNKEENCVFCTEPDRPESDDNLVVYRGQRAYVILNRYPYTSGHLMIVPFDHQPSLEMLPPEVRAEIMELAARAIQILQNEYHAQGFNLGVNIGEAAGAGIIGHVHMHVVPRWSGDTNFMSTLVQTRVLPESLGDTCRRVRSAWDKSL